MNRNHKKIIVIAGIFFILGGLIVGASIGYIEDKNKFESAISGYCTVVNRTRDMTRWVMIGSNYYLDETGESDINIGTRRECWYCDKIVFNEPGRDIFIMYYMFMAFISISIIIVVGVALFCQRISEKVSPSKN